MQLNQRTCLSACLLSVKDPGDRAAYVNKLYDQSLTLELLTWLGDMTTLPIVVKGILRGDSAELAARHPNVRGIVVSNHGGRQLDNCIAPLTALPEIVRVVDKVGHCLTTCIPSKGSPLLRARRPGQGRA
jgi:isopentenyl diphosphate isomerase/L-lactate dehydrogenase-like FMN-dependent dehydrogenase